MSTMRDCKHLGGVTINHTDQSPERWCTIKGKVSTCAACESYVSNQPPCSACEVFKSCQKKEKNE